MTTFNFIDDARLIALPIALREKMQAVQQQRINEGLTSLDGATYRTAEKRAFMDEVYNWKREGRCADKLKELKVTESNLRNAGLL